MSQITVFTPRHVDPNKWHLMSGDMFSFLVIDYANSHKKRTIFYRFRVYSYRTSKLYHITALKNLFITPGLYLLPRHKYLSTNLFRTLFLRHLA